MKMNAAGRLFCKRVIIALLLLLIAACAAGAPSTTPAPPPSAPEPTLEVAASATPAPPVPATLCALPTVVVPTAPAQTPGYTALDPATGLHVTGRPQEIDLHSYRLEVGGMVDRPLQLSYDDLRCMPRIQARPTLVCPGFFTDVATWAGASLASVLDLAAVQEGASGLRLFGADGYSADVPLAEALAADSFLAYEWEGQPLPIVHGFPVRAVFPGMSGGRWVKWLVKLEVY
jgi:DMSO/TMAO reductase YedYZ molybdopterin-dependent catalytic subunit